MLILEDIPDDTVNMIIKIKTAGRVGAEEVQKMNNQDFMDAVALVSFLIG